MWCGDGEEASVVSSGRPKTILTQTKEISLKSYLPIMPLLNVSIVYYNKYDY